MVPTVTAGAQTTKHPAARAPRKAGSQENSHCKDKETQLLQGEQQKTSEITGTSTFSGETVGHTQSRVLCRCSLSYRDRTSRTSKSKNYILTKIKIQQSSFAADQTWKVDSRTLLRIQLSEVNRKQKNVRMPEGRESRQSQHLKAE